MDNQETATIDNPFGLAKIVAAPTGGLVAVEQQRAIAEVQARMIIARANPRDVLKAVDDILEDCKRPTLAEASVYQYARGGTDVTGPTIKLAEAIARRWGNVASGIKEVARTNGYSECVAYAWDLETGYYDERQYQVKHWRDTKSGGYGLKDERDIYELIANMGQRRKRAVLLSIIPGDVVEAAVRQCEQTMKAKADTSPEAQQKMIEAFEEYRVSKKQIEKRIQRRLDSITPAQVVTLKKIYASLRDNMSSPEEWFEADDDAAATQTKTAAPTNLKDRVKAKVTPTETVNKETGELYTPTAEEQEATRQREIAEAKQ